MTSTLRILYNVIPHGVLEYDELKLLTDAGHRVFSLGDYWNRVEPVPDVRQYSPAFFDDEFTAAYLADPLCNRSTRAVSADFCKRFDLVIASGVEVWMHDNFPSFGALPVIFRTIGQSNLATEALLNQYGDRITVVRYSTAEVGLPSFARTDSVIYFGKDPQDFPTWTGGGAPVTFHSHYAQREAISAPRMDEYAELTRGFDAKLYGINTPNVPNYGGHLHYVDQARTLATAGCYLYIWSVPPSYTLSIIEAMMVGLPVVAPSAAFAARITPDPAFGWIPSRYDVTNLLDDGCGFTFDTLEQGRAQIHALLTDRALADQISRRSRQRALEKLNTHVVVKEWDALFVKLLGSRYKPALRQPSPPQRPAPPSTQSARTGANVIITSPDAVLNVAPERLPTLRTYIANEKRWFHCFDFPGGLTSPGYDPSAKKLHHLMLPAKLDGASVLDIGAYDGYFSFHAKQRGAERVVASDDFVWRLDNVPARHNLAAVRTATNLAVEDIECAVESLPSVFATKFDITMFLGVLYHAPDMIQYLRSVFAVTKTVCVLETLVDHLDIEGPSAAYYPAGTLNGDASNFWGPNISATMDMCRRVGFTRVEFGSLWHLNTRACIEGKGDQGSVKSGRIVIYAYV